MVRDGWPSTVTANPLLPTDGVTPPPLGPPPTPQPDCSTCRWPIHSWATIPASVHTSRTDTGPDGGFTQADLADLAKFPLVTIEKWQGQDAVNGEGERVFLWEEDAWAASIKQIKAVNPNISVVPWMDTMSVEPLKLSFSLHFRAIPPFAASEQASAARPGLLVQTVHTVPRLSGPFWSARSSHVRCFAGYAASMISLFPCLA